MACPAERWVVSPTAKWQERRNVNRRLNMEATIDPEVLAEFAALEGAEPKVPVQLRGNKKIPFSRVENGGEECPFGMINCPHDTCKGDPCQRLPFHWDS